MRKLIIARHGDYGHDHRISDYGRSQISRLTEKIRGHVVGKTHVVTSTAPRAKDSAEIIAKILATSLEESERLWSDCNHFPDCNAVVGLIRDKEGHDTLILVTHLEYGEFLHVVFGEKVLGLKLQPIEIKKGEAHVIDCHERTLTTIRL